MTHGAARPLRVRVSPGWLWDALIVGGGPAGLAAGIQLARAGYDTLLLERSVLGGQARLLERIENYPGFPRGIRGRDLMDRWVRQACRWGLALRRASARDISRDEGTFAVRDTAGGLVRSRALLYCPGAAFQELGVPGEARLKERGVYDAAFERAPLFKGRTVAVVGGGEAAVAQAILLSRHAKRVHLISRGGRLKAHRLLRRRLERRSNVLWLSRASVERAEGNGSLKGVWLRPQDGGERRFLKASALFVLIGKRPPRSPFGRRRPAGFFTAGDAARGDFRQVAVAGGDGIRAAMRCIRYLERRGGS